MVVKSYKTSKKAQQMIEIIVHQIQVKTARTKSNNQYLVHHSEWCQNALIKD